VNENDQWGMGPTRILVPGSARFDDAIAMWNGAVTRRPAVVVQPISAAEVQSVVCGAQDRGLALSVRGGGHDWAGRSVVEAGVMIDMSLLRQAKIAGDTNSVIAAGGATSADVIAAADPYGLVTPTGVVGEVGMVGLALGGGYGPLNGIAGLALDNVAEVQLVLADGRLVTADADNEPELFWALRGGGGSFGVITRLRLRTHRIAQVIAGVVIFDWQQASRVLANYDALMPTVPDELTVELSIATGPDGGPALFVWPTWSGPSPDADAWLAKVAGLGAPLMTELQPMPYSKAITLLDPHIVSGRHNELRTVTLRGFCRDTIDALIRAADTRTSLLSGLAIHHFHGAATRFGLTETAFGVREPHFVVEVLATWNPDDDDAATHIGWADDVYAELGRHAMPGGYPNLIGPAQAAQANAAYGPNAERLRSLKQRFDPDNVFFSTPPLPAN
jgi:FAD/FMN-containing dehydrogenase